MTAGSDAGAARAPALSYVVPTVGEPPHLADCLESIYRDASTIAVPAELIVVWQGSPSTAPGPATDGDQRAEARRCGPSASRGPAALRGLAERLAAEHPAAFGRPPRIVQLPRPAGFARAANTGIAASAGAWIALVNDDAVLKTGWTEALLEALGAGDGADPNAPADLHLAAAQGINLLPAGAGDEARIDGAGLAWNRRWQAVQIGRGETVDEWTAPRARRRPRRLTPRPLLAGSAGTPAHPVGGESAFEVYGVSATAAIYRRAALADASGAGKALRPFEERLDSYYEDVELADRLRGAGYRALLAPAACAEHAGALSSRSAQAARRRTRRVYANRLLVLARRLGRGFWPRLPVLLGRDALDALRRPATAPTPGDLEPPRIVDLLRAWRRAARLLPRFAHFGRRTERRSEADASRVSWPPSAAAGGDAGAPGVGSKGGDAGARGVRGAGRDAEDGQETRRQAGRRRFTARPVLSAVAPHWHDEEHLAVLVRDWPGDARFELIVVDNGSDGDLNELAAGRTNVRVLDPGRNLGFAAAVNRGAAEAGGDLILVLNTDAVPEPGALDNLVEGMAEHPDAAGLAPRLLGADDVAQAAWQLRRLPSLRTLVGYCCFVEPGPQPAPAAGTAVAQPAACALLLRRSAFESAGAMDERFWPAWFEDVDLARRLADRGDTLLYRPEAVFRHGLGASAPKLGYAGFLAAYYRNLDRYARKHHGRGAALLLRAVLAVAALLRIVLLPLRRPRRARGRGEALGGLWRLAVAAAGGWRGR